MLEKNFTWSTPIDSGICNIEVRNTLPYKLARYYEEMRTVERALEPPPPRPDALDRKLLVSCPISDRNFGATAMKTTKFSLRLDSDRYEMLQDLAEREGFTVSMIVRHLVYRFIEQERRLIGNSHD
jgi:hypothetical protein